MFVNASAHCVLINESECVWQDSSGTDAEYPVRSYANKTTPEGLQLALNANGELFTMLFDEAMGTVIEWFTILLMKF